MELALILILTVLGILMFIIGFTSNQKSIRYFFIIFGILAMIIATCSLEESLGRKKPKSIIVEFLKNSH